MASSARPAQPEGIDRTGLLIGCAVGVPAAILVGALVGIPRSLINSTNAALILMIVVVAVAAIGGRAAGILTALAAVMSFDFFDTKPYLSLTIDSRNDVETAIAAPRRGRPRRHDRLVGPARPPPCRFGQRRHPAHPPRRRGGRIGRRRRPT